MKTLALKTGKVARITRVEINAYLCKKLSEFLPKISSTEISGSCPPEVFVGRYNYPNIFLGPIISPLENSEQLISDGWFGKPLAEIFSLRLQGIRGKMQGSIKNAYDKNVLKIQEAILSKKSVEAEAKLKRPPSGLHLSLESQPYGPSAFILDYKLSPGRSEPTLEKVYYDTDMKAGEAVVKLFDSNVQTSKITQALSLGMLGVQRRLVPTRWSITAVDDIIGKHFIQKIRDFNAINEWRVYNIEYLNNKWVIILFPSAWQYESIEAWFPGTIVQNLGIGGDYEGFEIKKEYASIGGCWYAARAVVAEKLYKERRQAGVLILREVHEGYIPVGVWNVRESVKAAIYGKCECFNNMREALAYAMGKLTIPFSTWLQHSQILKNLRFQRSLFHFM